MHKISLKIISKEPIFTVVERKSLVSDSNKTSVHVHFNIEARYRDSPAASHVEDCSTIDEN